MMLQVHPSNLPLLRDPLADEAELGELDGSELEEGGVEGGVTALEAPGVVQQGLDGDLSQHFGAVRTRTLSTTTLLHYFEVYKNMYNDQCAT